MAGFNRFGGGGLGSLYSGISSLQQGNNRRDDRFENRRNARDVGGFDRRGDRDFGRRETSPRRRRYSPDPPYSGMRGSRQDDRGGLGSFSMDDLGRDSFSRNRGQSTSDRDHIRDGHNLGPPNRGDGILGAKPGDMPRDLTPNPSSGFTSQLAQQQQQLMAMVQTQSLLAAIQAQASAAVKRGGGGGGNLAPPSLLHGMRIHDNRGHMDSRQNRKRRMSPPRGGQRNMNQANNRQRRSQQHRSWQGNRSNYQQRRDTSRDRNRATESSRKSEDEPVEEPYVEEKLDEEEEEDVKEAEEVTTTKTSSPSKESSSKKSDSSSSEKQTKSEEPKSESLPDDPEFKSELNLAGQNVNNLVKSLFDTFRGKYVCKVCKIMCTREMCFKQHLYGRRHVKTWLESRGHSFEAEMFKKASEEAAKSLASKEQAKVPKEKTEETPVEKQEKVEKEEESTESKMEEEPSVPTQSSEEETSEDKVKEEQVEVKKEDSPPPPPEPKKTLTTEKEDKTSVKVKEEKKPERVKEEKKVTVKEEKLEARYSCDTRKVAVKDGEVITISSITEARVKLKGFDKGVNTLGCEFVKAVSGFNCRLCKSFILSGSDVMKHVEGRKHQAKYRQYIREHPKYESNQADRNKELSEMLSEREGEEVLLYEVLEAEEQKRPHRYGSTDSTLDVEVTRYVMAEEEADDTLEDQDTSNDNVLGEETEMPAADEKKQDLDEDDLLNDIEGEDKDLESIETDENLLLMPQENLEDKHSLDLQEDNDTAEEENENKDDTEIKEDLNTSTDSFNESQEEEPLEKKAKLTTPAARRGRRAARGTLQTRGRGRGRGIKRTTRQSPKVTPKLEVPSEDKLPEQHNDDENFMEGYEVIDEVVDDE